VIAVQVADLKQTMLANGHSPILYVMITACSAHVVEPMLLSLTAVQVADLKYNTLTNGHGPILHILTSMHHTHCRIGYGCC
jgi:hypothetical protein